MNVKGFKYRIYPTDEQKVLLAQTFGSCRYVYNYCLDRSITAYQTYKADLGSLAKPPGSALAKPPGSALAKPPGSALAKPSTNYYQFAKWLSELKQIPEHSWLYDVSSAALQQSVKRLDKAFSSFFKQKGRVGYPKFRSRHQRQSATLPTSGFRFHDNQLFIAKSKEPIRVVWSRDLPSEPTSATITLTQSGRYFISFTCAYQPVPTNGQDIIGIDLGIKTLATISDGGTIANPRHYVKSQFKLRKLQRQHSHHKKGSANRNYSRLKLAKLHEHIANQRQDYLHKLTSKLVSENQAICIEDLNVAGMSKNHNLAKHILDASFGTFRQLLTYKVLDSSWCRVLIADRYYPSTQLCSNCGTKPTLKIKLGIDKWVCQNCQTTHGRDDNASRNLLSLAIASTAKWLDFPGHIVLLPRYETI